MAGIIKPKKGRLKILNRAIGNYTRKDLARTMAFVPQTMPVDFPFSVIEVVLMGRSPYMGMLGVEQEEDLKIAKQALSSPEPNIWPTGNWTSSVAGNSRGSSLPEPFVRNLILSFWMSPQLP